MTIQHLTPSDYITTKWSGGLTTQLGTRSYEVYSVSKIGVDDTSVLNDSTENIITLVTCVMNQPDYRWCVQAREK
jgi:sortase (surface protein transpeptidase)